MSSSKYFYKVLIGKPPNFQLLLSLLLLIWIFPDSKFHLQIILSTILIVYGIPECFFKGWGRCWIGTEGFWFKPFHSKGTIFSLDQVRFSHVAKSYPIGKRWFHFVFDDRTLQFEFPIYRSVTVEQKEALDALVEKTTAMRSQRVQTD